MSKTKKVISVVLAAALIMAMATVAMVSASAATTVYFEKPDAWDAAYAYIWDDVTNNGWAGVMMTDCGNGLWSIDAEPGANIIFTNGTGGVGYQTADNVVPMDGSNCAYLNGETATNGYGEVFDAIGWKTVEAGNDETT
ncbi:MAG: starch-binding protein, partial [Ruminococcus sp.]|nr:starch-binding protein [Ruminococcus sp.]